MQTTGIDIIQVVEVIIASAATYLIARIVSELSSKFLRRRPFQRALRALKMWRSYNS